MRVKLNRNANASEKKVINAEIRKQILEADKLHAKHVDALVLYAAMVEFDLDLPQLKHFYRTIAKTHQDLINFYEMPPEEGGWLCAKKLEDLGVDFEAWAQEMALDYPEAVKE